MYLKALTIRGFKSFADKTSLRFEPGTTVVVGPNGSGKSNITDAVLWVLGEQSARSLRGSAMEDVIFAGSPARSSSGIAEVSLFLDNSDGTLPIEFSEVSITRRISRIGESEYLINNAPCRLLDVQDLLMDSGLGKEMYSIVSQGKLEEILTSKPEERRILIEEAAGVLKHKIRKERALRKLTSMEHSLTRAKDVLKEVDRQLEPLERQAKKNQAYRTLAQQLRDAEISLSVKRIQELKDEWSELVAGESEHGTVLGDLKAAISQQEEDKECLRNEIEEQQTQLLTLEEEKRRLQTCMDRVRSSSSLLRSKKEGMTVREQEIRQKIHQFEQRVRRREEENIDLVSKKNLIEKRKEDLSAKLNRFERQVEDSKAKEEKLTEDLIEAKSLIRHAKEAKSEREQKLRSAQAAADSIKLRTEFVTDQVENLARQIKDQREEFLRTKDNYLEQRSAVARLGKEEQVLKNQAESENEVLGKLQLARDEVKEKLTATQAEQKAFHNLRAALSEFSGLEVVQKAKTSGILGVIGELIRVPKKHQKAIEAALGQDLLCLLVETIEDAQQVVSLMSEEKLGRVSMLPAAGLRRKFKEMTLATDFMPASAVVECEYSIREAVLSLLEGVFIVPDTRSALEFLKSEKNSDAAYTLVTSGGVIVQSTGKIQLSAGDQPLRLIHRENLQELEKEAKQYGEDLKRLEQEISAKQARSNALSSDVALLTREFKENEFALQGIIAEQRRIENEITKMKSQELSFTRELQECESKLGVEIDVVAAAKEEIVQAAETLERLEKQLAELGQVKEKILEQRKETEQEAVRCKLELEGIEAQENYLTRQTGLISEDQAELQVLLDSEQRLREGLDQFSSRVGPLQELLNELIKGCEQLILQASSLISMKENALQDAKDKLSLKRAETSTSSEQVGKLQEKIQNIKVSKAELEVQVKAISQEIAEEFGIPLDKAINEYQIETSAGDMKRQASELRSKIEVLGPVNPIAIEQFSELKERQEFLADQINDLTESRQALEKVASAIDKKIKDRFLRTFQQVNFNFQSVFAYLFEGGEAELSLDDPSDPLGSGISFDAHPAGKRLQKVTLLSGGEAALVALTFLFAIHHTRPSPFYILDEVEPALDSMNLQRFTHFLKAQSEKTQFIIITHQKRTMEIADLLYGVSMSEEGVSTVISQRLTEFQEAQDGTVYAS